MCNGLKCKEELNNKNEVVEYINIQTSEKLDLDRVRTLKDNAMLKVKPELWCEWDFEKNNELGFDIWKVTKGSNKSVWWTCPICKSSYNADVNKRLADRNCPYCSGRRVNNTNSLFIIRPEQAKQWHPTKNGSLTPHDITANSPKKIWWLCEHCGSEWLTNPNSRSKGQGCPYCSGRMVNHTNSLASLNPQLALQWHSIKNGKLTPNDVTISSNQKVWWLGECGHEWEATVSSRNRKHSPRGCPVCNSKKILIGYNDMWTTNPEMAELLADSDDGYKYMYKSNLKLNWKCPSCNSILNDVSPATVNQFGLSCNKCSTKQSLGEKMMIALLDILNKSYKHDRTMVWSDCKRYDFLLNSLNVIIEMHGVQHYKESRRKGARTLEDEKKNDKYKYEMAIANGILPENYIVIDCRKSDFEFIKNNIMNSRLAEIFDLDKVNWTEVFKAYNNPKTKKVCDDFLNGITNKDELAKKYGIHKSTVYQYLKKGKNIGWI